MSKFKVGDRVRRISKDHVAGNFPVGMEGVVTSIKGYANRYVINNHPDESHDPDFLELVPSSADIDREMMENSEMYVQGRFAQMILQEVGKSSAAYYDAAQIRAAFRAGYDYAMRTEASARETLASIQYALDRNKK